MRKVFRKNRTPPQKDVKILADWNFLLCSALIQAHKSFGDERYLYAAKKILLFFEKKIDKNKNLFHSYCKNSVGHKAFLSDFACLIKSYLDLYSLEFNKHILAQAKKYTDIVLENFYDKKNMQFCYKSLDSNDFKNIGNIHDSATQSGSGVMLENLFRMYIFIGNDRYIKIVDECIKRAWPQVKKNPFALSSYVHVANLVLNSHHIVVIKENDGLFYEVSDYLAKNLFFNTFVCIDSGLDLKKNSPAFGKKTLKNKTTVYICNQTACYEPINELEKLKKKLNELPFL